MVENWNISENRGGPEIFLEIASIAQFLSEIKKEGIKLFRRVIHLYTETKTRFMQRLASILRIEVPGANQRGGGCILAPTNYWTFTHIERHIGRHIGRHI